MIFKKYLKFLHQKKKKKAFRDCISLLEAAVTKYNRLGSQNTSSLFSHGSGSRKSKIKVLAGLVSREAPPVGAETAIFSLWPHLVFSLCDASLVPHCVSKLSFLTRTSVRLI